MDDKPRCKKPKNDLRKYFTDANSVPESTDQSNRTLTQSSCDTVSPVPGPSNVLDTVSHDSFDQPCSSNATIPSTSEVTDDGSDFTAHVETDTVLETPILLNDIGRIFLNGKRDLGKLRELSGHEKCILLTDHWMPGKNFNFPKSKKSKQNVNLSVKHFTGVYHAFKYSPSLEGLVCVPCVLFGPSSSENDRKKDTKLGQLVLEPLRDYGHLTGSQSSYQTHMNTQYHKATLTYIDSFLKSIKCQTDIKQALDVEKRKQAVERRARLVPIIKTTILCSRLGISYRGRRDDGILDPDVALVKGDGNFKALLAFRIDSGDTVLREHLKTKNATYISKTTQNEIIKICGDVITEQIVTKIKKAQFYSVIADETTDTAHLEQLCICIRFVSVENGIHSLREEFIDFSTAHDLTGAGLARQIVTILTDNGLEVANLVGQGYDGAAAMSGHINGVQQHVRSVAPSAVYVHCGSHVLNLVLNSSCVVPEIRDMFAAVRETTDFINSAVKRRELLETIMGDKNKALKTFCETRFVERHDALLIFADKYEYIVGCLDHLTKSADRKTSDKARSLLKAVTDSAFLVALCCAKKLMALTIILSKSLQTVDSELVHAMASVNHVIDSVNLWRSDDMHWDDDM